MICLRFWIPGRTIPKARPRVGTKRPYLPANYRCWRRLAELEIINQIPAKYKSKLPIECAHITIKFTGKHRGDPDNCSGSCLDALVSAGVLKDDSFSCIPELVVSYDPLGELGVAIALHALPTKVAVVPKLAAKK